MVGPSKLGKYEIRGELGRGAMGVVYEAFDPLIERRVAIKTIRADAYDGANLEAVLQRFEREAKAVGRLNHPRVVAIYDYGQEGDTAYIVMELVDGKPLSALFERQTQFMLADSVRIVSQILDALEHAHSNGVIHRDIKPANILVLPNGDIKVTDFGIARLESSTLTQTGSRLGTPLCMSPEQFLGKDVDRRTDIFSTGVILYELLTGERPFPGSSLTTIMHQVLKVDPPLPTELNVTLPPALDAVVRTAIAKRPEERYPNAEQFSRALQLAVREQAAPAVAKSPVASLPAEESSLGFEYLLKDTHAVATENTDIAPTQVLERSAVSSAAPLAATARNARASTLPLRKKAPAGSRRWPWVVLVLLAMLSAVLFLKKQALHATAPSPALLAARPVEPPPEPAPASNESAMELAFWDSIRNSRDESDFNEYLRKYPTGQFSGLAQNRLAQLQHVPNPEARRPQPRPTEEGRPISDPEPGKPFGEMAKNDANKPHIPVEIVMQRAREGRDMAMNNLGMLYRDGRDVPQSDKDAVYWFSKAVEKGNAKAMTNLALMYFKGRGVPRDEEEARKLLRRASALGDDHARDLMARGGQPDRRRPHLP